MISLPRHFLGWIRAAFVSRADLILENLALRQQLLILHAQRPRHRLSARHKLFWVALRSFWSGWTRSLVFVTENRSGVASSRFLAVFEMAVESETGRRAKMCEQRDPRIDLPHGYRKSYWGAPRIHGELLKLGFDLSEPTVSRWLRKQDFRSCPAVADLPAKSSRGHCSDGLLHGADAHIRSSILLLYHRPRPAKILRCSVTQNPAALWVVQQLRETWPYEQAHRFLLFDRDSKFGKDVISAVTGMSSQPIRTAFRSPWQNGVAERWVGSCRRDLLDHVIVLNERHLRRLMAEYVRYYH